MVNEVEAVWCQRCFLRRPGELLPLTDLKPNIAAIFVQLRVWCTGKGTATSKRRRKSPCTGDGMIQARDGVSGREGVRLNECGLSSGAKERYCRGIGVAKARIFNSEVTASVVYIEGIVHHTRTGDVKSLHVGMEPAGADARQDHRRANVLEAMNGREWR